MTRVSFVEYLTADAEMSAEERSPHASDGLEAQPEARVSAPADSFISVTLEEEEAWQRMGALE